jgi:transcription initiation factor TFIIIB Brf1 subunit/transcription initiation factor TFIIB
MNCRICGSEKDVEYRAGRRGALCASCASDTPDKVSRAEFDAAYWDEGDDAHEPTRAAFYEDYRNSPHSLEAYIAATVRAV